MKSLHRSSELSFSVSISFCLCLSFCLSSSSLSPPFLSLCVCEVLYFLVLGPARSSFLGLPGLPDLSTQIRDTARLLLSFPFLHCSLEILSKG